MEKKKPLVNSNVRRAAAILEEHFATLPKGEEKKARKALHKLAMSVSRRAPGKPHDLSEARGIVLQPVLPQELRKFLLCSVLEDRAASLSVSLFLGSGMYLPVFSDRLSSRTTSLISFSSDMFVSRLQKGAVHP